MGIKIHRIIRSDRKSISIILDDEGRLIIRAPKYISNARINSFVLSKEKWILNNQQRIKKRANAFLSKQFVEGESFLLLGQEYTLKITDAKKIMLFDNMIIMPRKLMDNPKGAMISYYKDSLLYYAKSKADIVAFEHGLNFRRIKISSAQKRWGSCNSKGNINLTYRLCMAPDWIIDYVIVHELCHTVHLNHSKDFWYMVGGILPDYKTCQKWLKDNGYLLNI